VDYKSITPWSSMRFLQTRQFFSHSKVHSFCQDVYNWCSTRHKILHQLLKLFILLINVKKKIFSSVSDIRFPIIISLHQRERFYFIDDIRWWKIKNVSTIWLYGQVVTIVLQCTRYGSSFPFWWPSLMEDLKWLKYK